MTDCEDNLVIVNAGSEVERAGAWLERFAGRTCLPPDITSKLQVVMDEILSNILVHALPDAAVGERQIWLGVRSLAGRVELEVTDDGPEFDPTLAFPDRTGMRIAGRQPGGVGLLFVKSLMDDMHFARQGGLNRLFLALHVPTSSGGAA